MTDQSGTTPPTDPTPPGQFPSRGFGAHAYVEPADTPSATHQPVAGMPAPTADAATPGHPAPTPPASPWHDAGAPQPPYGNQTPYGQPAPYAAAGQYPPAGQYQAPGQYPPADQYQAPGQYQAGAPYGAPATPYGASPAGYPAQPAAYPAQPGAYPGQAAYPAQPGAYPYQMSPAAPATPLVRSPLLGLVGFGIVVITGLATCIMGWMFGSVLGPVVGDLIATGSSPSSTDPEIIAIAEQNPWINLLTPIILVGIAGWIVSIVAAFTRRGRGYGVWGIILGLIAPILAMVLAAVAMMPYVG